MRQDQLLLTARYIDKFISTYTYEKKIAIYIDCGYGIDVLHNLLVV
jgi:hypothetical protein